mmetsp:Transcript_7208/g.13450  ORF Transcript_7208/g.13450 Transcript_7208/m.13450 type:complete len:418 (-) Transcript_7208:204-1457(-)
MVIVVDALRFFTVGFRVVRFGLIGVAISLSIRPLRLLSKIISPNLRKTISLLRAVSNNDDDNDKYLPSKMMKELDPEKLSIYVTSLIVIILATPFIGRMEPGPQNPQHHIIYAASVAATLLLLPESIQDEIFSPGGVVVVGTILPIYESILAVCTIKKTDDIYWLQYWITSGTLTYATEFIDKIRDVFPRGGERWYEFEFFFTLWLLLPYTDGAYVIYEWFTRPLVAPVANRITGMMRHRLGWIKFLLLVVNASHLWIVWFVFVSFPEEQRRFVVVAVGTVYPTAASIAAVSSKDEKKLNEGADLAFWLTYWSTFSILFLAMDYLENFLGEIRGFYTTCLCVTVWLFLPMFNGADYVFRQVLVPLTGQYENLILRDVHNVKMVIMESVPEKHRSRVLQRAADMLSKTETVSRPEKAR